MSLVYDLILAGIVVFCLVRGWRQGLLSALLRVLGWVAALALAARFAGAWASAIYTDVIEARVINTVTRAIPPELVGAIQSGADATLALQSLLDSLPPILGSVTIDPSVTAALRAAAGQDAAALAASITHTVLEPTLLSLTRTAVSAAILAASLFVFNILARLARGRRRDSVLSRTNAILGGALGLAEAFAVCYLYAMLLSLLSQLIMADWLSPSALADTRLVSLFMRI